MGRKGPIELHVMLSAGGKSFGLERGALVEKTLHRPGARRTARIALGLVVLVTLIPALVVAVDSSDWVIFVALGAGVCAAAYAGLGLHLSAGRTPRWLPAVNCAFYASVISGLMFVFIVHGQVRTLSWLPILFLLYILLIGASCLRQEERLPLVSGAVSAFQLLAVTAYARHAAPEAVSDRAEALLREFDWVRTAARLFILSAATVLATELARRGRMLHEQTFRDTLTGLLNRASFDQVLDAQVERSRKQRFPLWIAMLDLDHFKQLNDTRGHAVGDLVLRRVGETLQTAFGEHAIVGRYGGEEFVAVLTDSSEANVLARLEAVRRALEELDTRDPRSGAALAVTVSIGAACWPEDGADLGQVFRSADERLYAAKKAGRNRVELGQWAA